MRIQHNIMAMSAYRNYTNNVSAMKANLEKLSSGYKINRAGDDAAGLAISEKMRAQITGLETAQKNAKDGISLVQTAEGALTEVHDMLNRMVELATQSANGTYDSDTDRYQLQKEMNQLREEIDRIAEASNFNGIQLLDGTMDAGGAAKQVAITLPTDSTGQFGEIGDKTITKSAGSAAQGTVFGVQFDNLAIDAKAGDKLTVQIGNDSIDIDFDAAGKVDAKGLATKLQAAFAAGAGTIGGQAFTAAVGTDGTSVIFTQTTPPTGTTDTVEASMDVKMSFTPNGGTASVLSDDGIQSFEDTEGSSSGTKAKLEATVTVSGTVADGDKLVFTGTDFKATFKATVADGNTTWALDSDAADNNVPSGYSASFDGSKLIIEAATASDVEDNPFETISATADGSNTGVSSNPTVGTPSWTPGVAASGGSDGDGDGDGETKVETVTKDITVGSVDFENSTNTLNAQAISDIKDLGEITVDGTFKVDLSNISLTADQNTGADAAKAILQLAQKAADEWNAANPDSEFTYTNVRLLDQNGDAMTLAAGDKISIAADKTPRNTATAGSVAGVSGSYNAATVKITQGAAEVTDQRASTWINLGTIFGGDIGDGSTLTIGDDTYTFVLGDSNSYSGKTITLDKNASAADRINYAAKAMSNMDNTTFSIGNETTGGKITIDEKAGNTNYTTELGTHAGFESLFSAKSVSPKDDTKGLKLQIGDTAADYNQLKVSIGDCHAAALGIGDINIEDQDSAAKAIDAIKSAINYVSDVRGTLGATQNRLDHTINNLSVMTENIQDAESTIRDVDVAEEMMAYTKNNILIQASQAMLAQANQVPQGVLQLLQ